MSVSNEAVLEAVQQKLAEAVTQYEGEVKEYGEATKAVTDQVKGLSDDFAAMREATEGLKNQMVDMEQLMAGGISGAGTEAVKTWGETMIESDSYKSFVNDGQNLKARVEVKNTIIGEAAGEPSNVLLQADRLPGIVPGAFRALNILDFVNSGNTSSNQIEYTRELSWTDNSAETAEGAAKPESDLTFELVQDPVRTIAHWIKASKQVLDDAPMLASYIDRRMTHGVRNRLQTQILTGNGTSPNISGLNDSGRHTAFTPTASELALDGINRAKYAVIGADYSPNFVFLNPADWGGIERVKSTAAGNDYAAGDGAALSYINGGMTPLVWGLPVVASNTVPAGNFYLGDSMAFQLFTRQNVVVEMFEQDDTNVQSNLLTIRAEMRAALAVYTPAAVRYGALTA